MGASAHIQCISHAEQQKMMGLWVEKDEGDATNGEYTRPLVLCHITNESKVAFQLKHRLSPLFQENPKTAPVMHGSTTSNRSAMLNDEDGEYTPPLGPMPCH